jgi:hypothetical protein
MATSKDDKPKAISRDELKALSGKDLKKSWVSIKRRLLISIPETPAASDDGDGEEDTENLRPRERMARAHAAREARDEGGDDGDGDE